MKTTVKDNNVTRTEIRIINNILEQREIEAIKEERLGRLELIRRLRYVFAIPQTLEILVDRSRGIITQSDLEWLIRIAERMLFTGGSANKLTPLKQDIIVDFLPKLRSLEIPYYGVSMTFPDAGRIIVNEKDVHYVEQGLLLMEMQLKERLINLEKENEIFRNSLNDELAEICLWKELVKTYKNVVLDVIIKNTAVADLKQGLKIVNMLLKGLGLYEIERVFNGQIEKSQGVRDATRKLIYFRSILLEYQYGSDKNIRVAPYQC